MHLNPFTRAHFVDARAYIKLQARAHTVITGRSCTRTQSHQREELHAHTQSSPGGAACAHSQHREDLHAHTQSSPGGAARAHSQTGRSRHSGFPALNGRRTHSPLWLCCSSRTPDRMCRPNTHESTTASFISTKKGPNGNKASSGTAPL